VRFVLFPNEEHPSLPNTTMGSYKYAMRCRERQEKLRMIVLEMLGFYSDEEGSQKYPFPFNLLYPQRGNFIGFVGNTRSRQLVHACVHAFRQLARFPSQGAAAPERFKDIARSDHWSFWQAGYQALMVTDTSEFRNPYYHTELDTPDKLNFEHMARVVQGLASMTAAIANR